MLIIGSFSILGHCGQVYHTSNYHETIQHFCGPTAQIICQILVVIYMFGCNVTHMIVVGDQLIKGKVWLHKPSLSIVLVTLLVLKFVWYSFSLSFKFARFNFAHPVEDLFAQL